MDFLSDVVTYVRRIVKTPSNASLTDNLIIDYINRFYISDIAARIQLFDQKTKYQFQTIPGVDKYNMPLYDIQTSPAGSGQSISFYPVYQGFDPTVFVNGVQVTFQTQKNIFYSSYPNVFSYLQNVAVGNNGKNYTFNIPIVQNQVNPLNPPVSGLVRGHVDISGIIATGNNIDPPIVSTFNPNIPVTSVDSAVFFTAYDADGNSVVVQDSGQFLNSNVNLGLLMHPGNAPYGNAALTGGYGPTTNVINYFTGDVNVTFPVAIPSGVNINAQCLYFQGGLPRAVLFYNNTLVLRSPPNAQYLVELDAYLSPAAFLNSAASIPFGYMSEYIARGAARKLLADTGDVEQFNFYEPLFREQEMLVWKRSQRQFTSTRTETIYSKGYNYNQFGINNGVGGWT